MDIALFTQVSTALIGGIIGSLLTFIFSRNRDKVSLTYNFHREFNSTEMAKHRRLAARLIEMFPQTNFKELCAIDEQQSLSLLMIMRFYQRLWFSIKYKQIKKSLAHEFFSEVFYYWYYLSYRHNLKGIGWESSIQMEDLAKWFEKNDKEDKYIKEMKWADEELAKRVEQFRMRGSDLYSRL